MSRSRKISSTNQIDEKKAILESDDVPKIVETIPSASVPEPTVLEQEPAIIPAAPITPSAVIAVSDDVSKMSCGQFLSYHRVRKGILIDDLAHQTKIRRSILESLERDAKKDLPERVFVMGYVRTYCIAAGISVPEAMRRFLVTWGDDETSPSAMLQQQRDEQPTSSFSWTWLAPVLSIVFLVCVFWYVVSGLS